MKNALLLSLVFTLAGGGTALAYPGARSTTVEQAGPEARVAKPRTESQAALTKAKADKSREALPSRDELQTQSGKPTTKVRAASSKATRRPLVSRNRAKVRDVATMPDSAKARASDPARVKARSLSAEAEGLVTRSLAKR